MINKLNSIFINYLIQNLSKRHLSITGRFIILTFSQKESYLKILRFIY